jgi:hypothetical protein
MCTPPVGVSPAAVDVRSLVPLGKFIRPTLRPLTSRPSLRLADLLGVAAAVDDRCRVTDWDGGLCGLS